MSFTPEFQGEIEGWKNEDLYNVLLHSRFAKYVNETPWLKAHRSWIEANQFGFGDTPFHWLYWMIVEQMPPDFSFLEIGVFKGQTLSLVVLCAKQCQKNAICFGVTTLKNTPDVRCRYPDGDYAGWIKQIHDQFEVPQPELIVGRSDDAGVIQRVQLHEYHAVLIDGSHDYQDVVNDINNFAGCVKVGGFLLMDDSSIGRLNVGHLWSGLEDVSRAVRDTLDKDERFKLLMACGHLNVFQRIQ